MIDEFPILAIAAAYAEGTTIVRDAAELRHKESDRIQVLCEHLRSAGVQVDEAPDGFIIQGGKQPRGGTFDPAGDHRLAMALAVSGLNSRSPVTIQSAEIIQESFPGFQQALETLGAKTDGRLPVES
jgi:3-phosphoshikimate 1-carboxyvinyltransferase